MGLRSEIRAQWLFSDSGYPEELGAELEDDGPTDEDAVDVGTPGETRYNERVMRADPDHEYRDDAFQATYKYRKRGGYVTAKYLDVGEDFRADLGYVTRVDYRLAAVGAGVDHYFVGRHNGNQRVRLSTNLARQESQAGEMLNESRDVWLNFWGDMQSWVRVGYRNRDRVAKRIQQDTLVIEGNAPEFNEQQLMFRIETSPFRNGRLILAGVVGEQIDTDNYRLGDLVELEPEVRWTFAHRYEITLKNTYRQLDVEGGQRLFTENYVTLNLTCQFKRGSFVRLTMIDDYLKRDPDLYIYDEDELERDTSAELLFAWKRSQRNVFFIGAKGNVKDSVELQRPRWDESTLYVKYAKAF
jgi:hypothetical protein